MLAADGAFLPDGTFVRLPPVPEALLREGFRCAVLAFLVREHALSEELCSRMLVWRHSGFSVHNQVRIEAEDAEGRKKLAGTMLRAPMSLEKMTYDAQTGTVIYRSKMHLGLRGKGGAPFPPRELSGDARRPVTGVAVPAHPGSLRAPGALHRLVLQPRARGAGEGAQDSGCTGSCAGPVRFAHRARERTCERVRRARQVSLGAADPQGLRSRSARMPPRRGRGPVFPPVSRPDAHHRADRRPACGAAHPRAPGALAARGERALAAGAL